MGIRNKLGKTVAVIGICAAAAIGVITCGVITITWTRLYWDEMYPLGATKITLTSTLGLPHEILTSPEELAQKFTRLREKIAPPEFSEAWIYSGFDGNTIIFFDEFDTVIYRLWVSTDTGRAFHSWHLWG